MKLKQDIYVPSLKWRLGEYQALLNLEENVKEKIVPYISVPKIEFDFEEWKPRKTPEEHVKQFPERYEKKWGARAAWIGIDTSLVHAHMDDGQSVISHIYQGLSNVDARGIPVVHFKSDDAVLGLYANAIEVCGVGAAIRLGLDDLMAPKVSENIAETLEKLGIQTSDTDLIVDLETPHYEPYTDFARALFTAIRQISQLQEFRNFVLTGSAFPDSMADISKPGGEVIRHEWLFYQLFVNSLPEDFRTPLFGDHTSVSPKFVATDMRKIKPAGKIVYATADKWVIRKGSAFRDDPEQMHGLCTDVKATSHFMGRSYSFGDEYIADCAARKVGPSNQTRWKTVSINHHIVVAARGLASFAEAS